MPDGFRIGVLITVLMAGLSSAAASCPDAQGEAAVITSDYLRVVTLNVAHGRKDGRNQMLQNSESIRSNLLEVAQVLNRIDAHAVALQEADAESSWSGKFNHVSFLAEESGYPCNFHGVHASNRIYDFGTALLSRYPLQGNFSHSFKPSRPTTNKGFVAGAVHWNPAAALPFPMTVKLISVHLDFSRSSVRRSQVEEMIGILSNIQGPIVMMGDFNSDWQKEGSSVKYLADALGLQVYEPQAQDLGTYREKDTRLDWILISPDIRFRNYSVIPDPISDHHAVTAEIILPDYP